MLNELRIIFESLTEYDKWSVVSGLAWKHAAFSGRIRSQLDEMAGKS